MNLLPDLAALLAIAVLFGCGVAVGLGRGRYKITAPATSGHPMFERLYRVQMNTLEQIVLFLPALWLARTHSGVAPWLIGAAGLLWVLARILYAFSYVRDPATRGPGFALTSLATIALWAMAAWGLGHALLAG